MSFLVNNLPPPQAQEQPVENDPFFPAIDPAQLRKACRIDNAVTPERLKEALLHAMASVNHELRTFKATKLAVGIATLTAVPSDNLGGESVKCLHYRRAVYSAVLADLTEGYREVETTAFRDTKAFSDKPTDKVETKADEHRRTMRWAISDILALRRTTVDLI